MDTSQSLSSLIFELKIIEAKDIKVDSKTKGKLFVRCCLPLGNNNNKKKKKSIIGFNTREIPTNSNDTVWDESFSLECSRGSILDATKLKRESFVFEVRIRRKVITVFGTSFFGGSSASLLLGKAEISLEEVLESPNMVFDKWVCAFLTRGRVVGQGQPSPRLKVEIRVIRSVLKDEEVLIMAERRMKTKGNDMDECGCNNDHGKFCACDDYDAYLH